MLNNKFSLKKILSISALLICLSSFAQQQRSYDDVYQTLSSMIEDESRYNFKEAVFSVENAYLNGRLDTVSINREIRKLTHLCNSVMQSRQLDYRERDRDKVSTYAAVFTVMSQVIPVVIHDTLYSYKPFTYDFEDVFGHEDLNNLFVSKLLKTHTGNCNSLPYLYKILAEELGVTAHLALAPNHIYIKHKIQSVGWYNTELTTGIFPHDAWLMASGYIHLDAVTNGVFMKALNNKESIALTLVDLGQAYQKSFPDNDGTFILKCTQKAIETYPYFANAWILQAETHKRQYEKIMVTQLTTDINTVSELPEAQALMEKMNEEYAHIHKMGYRAMPENMYIDWLMSLTNEREKYENKKIIHF